jgi:hypothetical protein
MLTKLGLPEATNRFPRQAAFKRMRSQIMRASSDNGRIMN